MKDYILAGFLLCVVPCMADSELRTKGAIKSTEDRGHQTQEEILIREKDYLGRGKLVWTFVNDYLDIRHRTEIRDREGNVHLMRGDSLTAHQEMFLGDSFLKRHYTREANYEKLNDHYVYIGMTCRVEQGEAPVVHVYHYGFTLDKAYAFNHGMLLQLFQRGDYQEQLQKIGLVGEVQLAVKAIPFLEFGVE